MAGRGGRGGAQQSRTQALLNMGVERSELQDERVRPGGAPGAVTAFAQTPTYPPLKFKPLPLPNANNFYRWDATSGQDTTDLKDLSMNLMFLTKNMDRMRNSRFAIREEKKQQEIERYSDRYRPTSAQDDQELDLDWRYIPRQLWPANKQRKVKKKPMKKRPLPKPSMSVTASKRMRLDGETDEEMAKRLHELEAKESLEGGEKEEGAEDEEEEGEEGNKALDLGDEVEDEDEELDDGTDYAQDYFDNGEDFGVDEDDGLDDPGVY